MRQLVLTLLFLVSSVATARLTGAVGQAQPMRMLIGKQAAVGLTTVRDTVDANNRDAYWYPGFETLNGNSGGVEVIWFGNPDGNLEQMGFEFQIPIAQGTTVTTAYVTVRVHGVEAGTPSATTDSTYWYVADVDNAAVYVGSHTHAYTAHHAVTSEVFHDGSVVTASTDWTSPNLAAALNITLARAGWVSNNYIAVVMAPVVWESGKEIRIYDSNNGTQNFTARIVIEY